MNTLLLRRGAIGVAATAVAFGIGLAPADAAKKRSCKLKKEDKGCKLNFSQWFTPNAGGATPSLTMRSGRNLHPRFKTVLNIGWDAAGSGCPHAIEAGGTTVRYPTVGKSLKFAGEGEIDRTREYTFRYTFRGTAKIGNKSATAKGTVRIEYVPREGAPALPPCEKDFAGKLTRR